MYNPYNWANPFSLFRMFTDVHKPLEKESVEKQETKPETKPEMKNETIEQMLKGGVS